jgi:hypothetical protein
MASMIKRLSHKLELIAVYCSKMPDYQGIKGISVDLHVSLLRFCFAIIDGFKGTFYGIANLIM